MLFYLGHSERLLRYYRCSPLITTLNGQIPSAIFFSSVSACRNFFQTSWLACMNFVSYFPNPPPPSPHHFPNDLSLMVFGFICNVECYIQLFQKMLSKEKQTSRKPRPQGSMGSFNRSSLLQLKERLRNQCGDAEGKD